jgi:hypothetical protein
MHWFKKTPPKTGRGGPSESMPIARIVSQDIFHLTKKQHNVEIVQLVSLRIRFKAANAKSVHMDGNPCSRAGTRISTSRPYVVRLVKWENMKTEKNKLAAFLIPLVKFVLLDNMVTRRHCANVKIVHTGNFNKTRGKPDVRSVKSAYINQKWARTHV